MVEDVPVELDDPGVMDVPGVVVQGAVLPAEAVDPGAGVEHGGVVDGTPDALPAAPGMVDCGVAVSLVLPGGVVVCCSGRVPGAIVPGVVEFPVVLPGVAVPVVLPGMVPVGLEGVVAAGSCDVLVAPVELLDPACAGHERTSATLQAPARIIVEMSFINGLLLVRRALPAAEIVVDQKCPRQIVQNHD